MPDQRIITIGASAGGVDALVQLVAALPPDLPASLFVVMHIPAHGASALPQILTRKGTLPARHPADGEPIEVGTIYVAPPDQHLIVERGRVRLSMGPRENGHRPAVDPLFRSAAATYGRRVVGVVLSGSLDDGTAGMRAVQERGGVTIAQHPDDALFSGMPRSVLENVEVEHVLPLAGMAPLLISLAHTPVAAGAGGPMPEDELERETRIARFDLHAIEKEPHPGTPSGFGCPDCGGALFELADGGLVRFRCRVGHAWSPSSLLAEQSEALDVALWTAVRALEERAALATKLAERMMERSQDRTAARFREQAGESRHRAALIRRVLVREAPTADALPANESGSNG